MVKTRMSLRRTTYDGDSIKGSYSFRRGSFGRGFPAKEVAGRECRVANASKGSKGLGRDLEDPGQTSEGLREWRVRDFVTTRCAVPLG